MRKLLHNCDDIEHKLVKNPNWWEADQLVFANVVLELKAGIKELPIQLVVSGWARRVLNSVQSPDLSATMPPQMFEILHSGKTCSQGQKNDKEYLNNEN